jgi:hypothetical protein
MAVLVHDDAGTGRGRGNDGPFGRDCPLASLTAARLA